MTKYEVLQCLYEFLDQEYWADKNKSEEYIHYISCINPYIWDEEGTADPAYYEVFSKYCDKYFQETDCSVEQGLEYARRYLTEYNEYEHKVLSSNIDEAVEVFKKCRIDIWKSIYEKFV